MTDKEKIRSEIERRIEELQPCNTRENLRAHGAIAGYYQILSFIDSMQEEPKFKTGDRIKPIDSCIGSPRTIVDVCDSWYVTDQGTLDFEYEDNWEAVEEPVSEELEEAAVEAFKQIVDSDKNNFLEIFKAGAKWQFERVKEALLSEVLPCFMRGGEADEVVAKLDEVLNQKK